MTVVAESPQGRVCGDPHAGLTIAADVALVTSRPNVPATLDQARCHAGNTVSTPGITLHRATAFAVDLTSTPLPAPDRVAFPVAHRDTPDPIADRKAMYATVHQRMTRLLGATGVR